MLMRADSDKTGERVLKLQVSHAVKLLVIKQGRLHQNFLSSNSIYEGTVPAACPI
jgi:hypothetical protein